MIKVFFLAVVLFLAACSRNEAPPVPDPSERFVVLGANGVQSSAECVSDLATGLTWESKVDEGLHAARSTYSWYNPEQSYSELDYRGLPNGGECVDSGCDTAAFLTAVNETGHCGFNDWRLPSRDEMHSITDLRRGRVAPTAYLDFFPDTQSAEYWTAHDYSFQYDSAWAWSFEYGHDRVDWKKTPKYVRLVRGDSAELSAVKE